MEKKVYLLEEKRLEEGKTNCEGYTITWEDVGYKVSSDKIILNGLSGKLNPTEMCAIIGASGSGKSSFLDCLAGRKPADCVSGKVLVNGAQTEMKYVSRYCTQEEALFGNLTVYETLNYAAQFNLSQRTSAAEIESIVQQSIDEFGLSDVKDTIIG